jgi:hypothetical protein
LQQAKANATGKNMKTSNRLIIAALALGSSAWIAAAQTTNAPPGDGDAPFPPGGPGMRGHRGPPPFIGALDANRDGIIDADEIANATAALKKLDKDGDGQLSLAELLGPRPGGGPPGQGDRPPRPEGAPQGGNLGGGTNRPPVPPIFAALDTNHDGVIDADELANAPTSLKALDKNGDGQLTIDELGPPRRGRGGPGGFGGGRGPGGPPPGGDQGAPPEAPPQQ